ncbi:MAG: hypothetical protein KKC84_05115, partial [Candidatus Omnitrophica bacterium]|nr:hypothetical protein [Candidatus Omnitrophota bacterium]
LDLHCPYIKEELQSPSLKEYIEYLTAFLNAPAQKALLKDNPHIIQAYEEVREVMELSASDEIS